jgi:hypothetical protein
MRRAVTHILSFVHLCIVLILVLGFYSGLPGTVRTVYASSLCVVLLLSNSTLFQENYLKKEFQYKK